MIHCKYRSYACQLKTNFYYSPASNKDYNNAKNFDKKEVILKNMMEKVSENAWTPKEKILKISYTKSISWTI